MAQDRRVLLGLSTRDLSANTSSSDNSEVPENPGVTSRPTQKRRGTLVRADYGADQSTFLSLFRSVIEAAEVFFSCPPLDGCTPLPMFVVKPS
jgi:hypothetical protein